MSIRTTAMYASFTTFVTFPLQPNPAVRAEELEFHQPPLYYVLLAPLFPIDQIG